MKTKTQKLLSAALAGALFLPSVAESQQPGPNRLTSAKDNSITTACRPTGQSISASQPAIQQTAATGIGEPFSQAAAPTAWPQSVQSDPCYIVVVMQPQNGNSQQALPLPPEQLVQLANNAQSQANFLQVAQEPATQPMAADSSDAQADQAPPAEPAYVAPSPFTGYTDSRGGDINDIARYQRYVSLGQAPVMAPIVTHPDLGLSNGCNTSADCYPCAPCCEPPFCFTATFLYWQTHRPTHPFAARTNQGFDPDEATFARTVNAGFDDDPGYRLAMSYRFCSSWDVAARYTNFSNSGFQSVDNQFSRLLPLQAHPAFVSNSEFMDDLDFASSTLDLDYDVVDLEFGKNFLFCDNSLAFRAFGGVRYGRIDQQIRTRYEAVDEDTNLRDVDNIVIQSDMDALGLRSGGNLLWNIHDGFGIYTRGAVSLLYGEFDTVRQETLIQGINRTTVGGIDLRNNFDNIVPVTELALGLQYQSCRWRVAAGYEVQTWFNMVNDARFINDTITRREQLLDIDCCNLSFEGFFAEATLCF